MKNVLRLGLLATIVFVPALATAQTSTITRADFVINMMASRGLYGSGGHCFPDVSNQAFAPAVCEAKARGYVRGQGSGRFEPSTSVTLIDAAVMAMRLEGISLPTDSIWYRPAIEQLSAWNAIPRSVNSIVQPLTVQQANELLINVRNRRGSETDAGDDNRRIEHDDDRDDLTVSITESDDEVDPGDIVTYRIRIVNDDNDDVEIDVRAELDDDMIFVSATEDGEEDDDVVEWEDIEIDEDDDITLQLRVRIRSNADGNVVLRVEADDEVDEEETVVRDDDDDNDNDDIELTVEDSSDRVEPGDTVTYRIRLENNGNSDEDVDVEAELDDDMIFVSASSGGDEDDDVVEWDNIEVEEDEERTLLLTVRMRSSLDDGDTVRLRVKAAGHTETETTRIDEDADNDDDDDEDYDVDISITDVSDPVDEGEVITYRITVNNNEDNPIRIDVNAFLDEETSFSSASDAGDLRGDDEVRWQNIDISRNGSKTLLLGVRPRSSVRDGDTVRLRVEAGDDEDTETTRIEEEDDDDNGDIRVTITDSPDPAEPGDTVSYRIRVENLDNDDTEVDVRAFLDDDMTFVSATSGGDENHDEVEWENIDIDGDDDIELTLRVRISTRADDGDTVRLRVEAGDDEDTETTRIED